MTPVRIIMLFIIGYFVVFHVVGYIGEWIIYLQQRRQQRDSGIVTHHLIKPTFFKIKQKRS